MNKKELIAAVSKRTGKMQTECALILNATLEVVGETIANDEKVQLLGFGSFRSRDRKVRKGRNPRTGEEIEFKARKKAVFKPGRHLTALVNK